MKNHNFGECIVEDKMACIETPLTPEDEAIEVPLKRFISTETNKKKNVAKIIKDVCPHVALGHDFLGKGFPKGTPIVRAMFNFASFKSSMRVERVSPEEDGYYLYVYVVCGVQLARPAYIDPQPFRKMGWGGRIEENGKYLVFHCVEEVIYWLENHGLTINVKKAAAAARRAKKLNAQKQSAQK